VDLAIILALAALLAVVPPLVDRWALRRGASPETLAALAATTLLGVAAVPLAFAICTGLWAAHDHGRDNLSAAAIGGLLLIALVAGRTIARMLAIRRRWTELERVAAALQLPEEPGGVTVLPIGESLAFASGTHAFVSQGLIERLTPEQRRAVIEHEREHAARGHGRLLAVACALTHGAFDLHPARHATRALDRELDALADRAAARRVGDPRTVQDTMRAVAATASRECEIDHATGTRIRRLSLDGKRRPLIDAVVRTITLSLGLLLLASVCVSVHASETWLGVLACVLLLAGFLSLTRPALKHKRPLPRTEEMPRA
jgi:hypothetical protein